MIVTPSIKRDWPDWQNQANELSEYMGRLHQGYDEDDETPALLHGILNAAIEVRIAAEKLRRNDIVQKIDSWTFRWDEEDLHEISERLILLVHEHFFPFNDQFFNHNDEWIAIADSTCHINMVPCVNQWEYCRSDFDNELEKVGISGDFMAHLIRVIFEIEPDNDDVQTFEKILKRNIPILEMESELKELLEQTHGNSWKNWLISFALIEFGATGTLFLDIDQETYFTEFIYEECNWYREDLVWLTKSWKKAEKMINKARKFLHWLSKSPKRLNQVFAFLKSLQRQSPIWIKKYWTTKNDTGKDKRIKLTSAEFTVGFVSGLPDPDRVLPREWGDHLMPDLARRISEGLREPRHNHGDNAPRLGI